MSRRKLQQELPFETGLDARGRRHPKRRSHVKLGRKARPERAGFVPHVTRPVHHERHPVHVTMRRVKHALSFRAQRAHNAILSQIRHLARRGVRVIQYCIQHDHLHLMVEADDRTKLARSMQLLFSRVAFAVNRIGGRHGSLFRDRHHRHELKTPTEVRRVLVYIFFNTRKHDPEILGMEEAVGWIDECTSAVWFDGWSPSQRPPDDEVLRKRKRAGTSPLTTPGTWLARVGWHRAGGPIRFNETPKIRITMHL